jgi:tRNA A-37 threonylcarbamoyl transferase component Bud32
VNYLDLQHFIDLELDPFEPINVRRGGWSGVSRVEWAGEAYFIKRQVKHGYRDPKRFFLSTPTLRREYRNFLRLEKIGIKTPEIVVYAEQGSNAMMVTKELDGFIDLDTYLERVSSTGDRLKTFTRLTEILLKIHDHQLHHGCLYGKHVMVHVEDPENLAMIDLEKMKFYPRRRFIACKDISQLTRQTTGMLEDEKDLIVAAYEKRFPGFTRDLTKRLNHKAGLSG